MRSKIAVELTVNHDGTVAEAWVILNGEAVKQVTVEEIAEETVFEVIEAYLPDEKVVSPVEDDGVLPEEVASRLTEIFDLEAYQLEAKQLFSKPSAEREGNEEDWFGEGEEDDDDEPAF